MNTYHYCSRAVDLNIISSLRYEYVTESNHGRLFWALASGTTSILHSYTVGIVVKNLPDDIIVLLTLNGTYRREVTMDDMSRALHGALSLPITPNAVDPI